MPIEEIDEALQIAEDELFTEDDSSESPPRDIVSFNESRSCAELYRLYKNNKLNIQPDYQRDVVWQTASQTRFIDSLAKGLPIPSMCISLDYKTDTREVVDGLQRMSSIIRFLSDDSWRLSKLEDIDKRISNKTVQHIRKEHPDVYSRIEDVTIPVTVLRCDLSKRAHQEYLFTIFHRLNTGSVKLTNQEIRNCIYHGSFNTMLKRQVASSSFVRLFDISEDKKYRFSNEELLLRILALTENLEDYKPSLSKFLNAFMDKHRNEDEDVISNIEATIQDALNTVYKKILDHEPLPRLSKATTEALFVGIIGNRERLETESEKSLKEKFNALRNDELFSVDALKEGLSAAEKVKGRLNRSLEIFAK